MLASDRNMWTVVQHIGNVSAVSMRARVKLAEFATLILTFQAEREHVTVSELVQKVLDLSGYQRMLTEEKSMDSEARLENLGELLNAVRQFNAPTVGLPARLSEMFRTSAPPNSFTSISFRRAPISRNCRARCWIAKST